MRPAGVLVARFDPEDVPAKTWESVWVDDCGFPYALDLFEVHECALEERCAHKVFDFVGDGEVVE